MNSKFLLTELLIPVLCVNLLFSGARLATGQAPDSVDKDYSSELPRIAPRSPEEALESFQVLPGFKSVTILIVKRLEQNQVAM